MISATGAAGATLNRWSLTGRALSRRGELYDIPST
jgi:hypothetical protein